MRLVWMMTFASFIGLASPAAGSSAQDRPAAPATPFRGSWRMASHDFLERVAEEVSCLSPGTTTGTPPVVVEPIRTPGLHCSTPCEEALVSAINRRGIVACLERAGVATDGRTSIRVRMDVCDFTLRGRPAEFSVRFRAQISTARGIAAEIDRTYAGGATDIGWFVRVSCGWPTALGVLVLGLVGALLIRISFRPTAASAQDGVARHAALRTAGLLALVGALLASLIACHGLRPFGRRGLPVASDRTVRALVDAHSGLFSGTASGGDTPNAGVELISMTLDALRDHAHPGGPPPRSRPWWFEMWHRVAALWRGAHPVVASPHGGCSTLLYWSGGRSIAGSCSQREGPRWFSGLPAEEREACLPPFLETDVSQRPNLWFTDLEHPSSPEEIQAFRMMAQALGRHAWRAEEDPLVTVLLPRVPRSADAGQAEFLDQKRLLCSMLPRLGLLVDTTGRAAVFDEKPLLAANRAQWDEGQDLDAARRRIMGSRLDAAQRERVIAAARLIAHRLGLDRVRFDETWVLTRPLPHPLFLTALAVALFWIARSGRYMPPGDLHGRSALIAELSLLAGAAWALVFVAQGLCFGDAVRFAALGQTPGSFAGAVALWSIVTLAVTVRARTCSGGSFGRPVQWRGLRRPWWCRRDTHAVLQAVAACATLLALLDVGPSSSVTGVEAVAATAGPCALMAAGIALSALRDEVRGPARP